MLDALTLNQLRIFVAVAEAGSFRAAASRLMRVPSAVSHAIETLENQLGTVLFDRSGLRPVLTDEGRSLLSDARAILLKVDAMRARARGLADGAELAVSIVADTLFPFARLSHALGVLRAAFPGGSIALSVTPLGGPIDALLEGRSSIGIICGEDFRDPRVDFEALAPVEIVSVVAATHPLAQMEGPLRAIDLADHLQIVLADPTARGATSACSRPALGG